jgi:hypothetical protein
MRRGRRHEFVEFVITKSPTDLLFRKRKQASAGLDKIRWRPEHFCASVEKAAKGAGQVSWLRELDVLITVARPRGIHTRFPILPVTWGTQTLVRKIRFD